MIIADTYSGWFEIDHLPDTKAVKMITKISMQISRYAIPDTIMSDNGPQFSNEQFKKFTSEYGILHKTSSPRYPTRCPKCQKDSDYGKEEQ